MIHYSISGDSGPWLVFVHGLTCTADDWQAQVAALSADHRCLSVDLRGHGRSAELPGPYDPDTMAADVAGVMHGFAIDNAILIGHSMGTRVITALAMQLPQRVTGLVFVDGSQQGLGDPFEAKTKALGLLGDDAALEQFAGRMFDSMFTERSDAAQRRQITARAQQMPPTIFRALFGNMAAWDAGRLEPALALLDIPVTVVQSTKVTPERERFCLEADESTPYLDMLRKRIKQVKIVIVPNTGHFTQLDAPDAVTNSIRELSANT